MCVEIQTRNSHKNVVVEKQFNDCNIICLEIQFLRIGSVRLGFLSVLMDLYNHRSRHCCHYVSLIVFSTTARYIDMTVILSIFIVE